MMSAEPMKNFSRSPAAEDIDARVLQEAADDRAHADRLACARDARADRAHAANDEVDLARPAALAL